jgi:exopolysaccharide biosynthesis predicted pyruvyltransferase EpsI
MNILDVSDYLKSTASVDGPFYYCPNTGNAGDALMATASFELFDSLGLNYSAIFPTRGATENFTGKVLVLAGGGNFTEGGYNNYAKIVARWHQKVKRLIVLPHTVSGNEALLSELGKNVDIICREQVSYEHVKRVVKRANVYLAHDMAFSLNVPNMLSQRYNYPVMLAKRVLSTALRLNARRNYPKARFILQDMHDFAELRRNPNKDGVLNVFRVDIEKTDIAIPEGNIDLSLRFEYGLVSRQLIDYMTSQVFAYLNHFQTVRTNRLHISIAAALLGKTVELYPNNYYKIRSVYEQSLKDDFPNVVWQS